MDDVINALKMQVETNGLFQTAILLGHNNTQTIRRWLKEGKMPEGKVKGTRAILEASKLLKAKRG